MHDLAVGVADDRPSSLSNIVLSLKEIVKSSSVLEFSEAVYFQCKFLGAA